MFVLIYAINLFARILITLICVEAIMSWFTGSFTSWMWRIYNFLDTVTQPFIAPFRALIWRFSGGTGIDFSPVVAILAIQLVAKILTNIILVAIY